MGHILLCIHKPIFVPYFKIVFYYFMIIVFLIIACLSLFYVCWNLLYYIKECQNFYGKLLSYLQVSLVLLYLLFKQFQGNPRIAFTVGLIYFFIFLKVFYLFT